jgi:hypothetical protein
MGTLLAQDEDADALADLKACAAIERSNARLACYDGVLGRTSPAEPAATTAGSSTPPRAPAAAGPGPAVVVGGAAAVSAAAGAASEVASSAPDTASSAPASAAPNAAASAPAPPPPATDDARQTIVVTELRLRSPTNAVFVTANGQVWEQSDNGRGRYPETPFEATLEKGSLNSTFLVSPAGGPRIRVRLRQ